MSGSSNTVSRASSGSSNVHRRCRDFVGLPKNCWCGESIIPLMSKSNTNPYRRYFRCAYATAKRLEKDEHIFKWIDEALLDEVEALKGKNVRIEQELKENARESLVFEKIEKEIFDRAEEILAEANTKMKKTIVTFGIGCVVVVVVGLMILLFLKKL